MQTLDDFLATLNPAQREAVLHTGEPLLILAGAGSGKTRVIIGKIAYLIGRAGIDPRSILAVTFTNKAAEEMRTRASLLEPRAADVMIRTFHSFGAWLLRRNAHLLGMNPRFTIYDDDDQLTLLSSLHPDSNRNQLRGLANRISRAKDYGLGPEDDLGEISHEPEFRAAYTAYERRLREIGNADFGDLILGTSRLLLEHEAVRIRVHDRFRVILVDEYQDSNIAQYRMLQALAGPGTYICVVGDDDQSIYRFRGAQVANILGFAGKFPGTRTIRLEQNYRSTGSILALAGAVVRNNEGRLGKELWTENPDGETPSIVLFSDGEQEAAEITALLEHDLDAGRPLSDTAILYRTNAQSRLFETALLHSGIAYRIVGTLRFYEREEIKDALAFLKFIANPKDEIGFRRIVNKPARGIGESTVQKILSHLGAAHGSIPAALELAAGGLSAKAKKSVREFIDILREIELPPTGEAGLGAWIDIVIKKSGLAEYHIRQDEVAGTQKQQNLEELINAASLYENSVDGLVGFLEAVELDSTRDTADENADAVTLITMHNTKGLEFDRVVCTGMEEGLFPRENFDPDELEEERRLFYVAATRARTELVFTSCSRRRIRGRFVDCVPSRFLTEIPTAMRRIYDRTMYGGGAASAGFSSGKGFGAHPGASRTDASRPDTPRPKAAAWNGRTIDLEQARSLANRRHGTPADGGQRGQRGFVHPKGTRLYHDDYGAGEVIDASFKGSEEVITVRFETGFTAVFLPRYTQLERIE